MTVLKRIAEKFSDAAHAFRTSSRNRRRGTQEWKKATQATLERYFPKLLRAVETENGKALQKIVAKLRRYRNDIVLLRWEDSIELAAVAHFVYAHDLPRALSNFDLPLIQKSVEYGYLSWPRKIQAHIEGRSVLDVGCGFGGFGNAFLAAGAAHYTGLDPLMVLDADYAKNKRKRTRAEIGYTPIEIMARNPDIELICGKSEDIEHGRTFDCISLHNVTEHLQDFATVVEKLAPVCHASTVLLFNHHNYYGWNGHHKKPKKLSDLDPNDADHVAVADWNHVINSDSFPADHYVNTGLNKITLGELRDIVEKYFAIEVWTEIYPKDEVSARLTPEIITAVAGKHPQLTQKDLEINAIFCVARRHATACK